MKPVITRETEMLQYQARMESNARTYARSVQVVIERGQGARVYTTEGRCLIDCLAGAGALVTGHNHPRVTQRMQEFLASGHIMQGLDIATPTKDAFMRRLFETLPAGFRENAKIQFCGPTGADAIEAAIKLFKSHTGRQTLLAFHGAYHGMTTGALAMTGNLSAKTNVNGSLPGVHFLPYPYAFRCPFGVGGAQTHLLSINYIASLLDDPESGITKPAALFVEAVQGEGGCIPVDDEWLRELRRLTTEHDIPLIVDEVQTGFGRTGSMYAFERAGITPDAIIISKAIGGGLPFSALLYHRKYDTWSPGAHAGTFRGNQLAMAAGMATLEVIESEGLVARAAQAGSRTIESLRALAAEFDMIGDVRGRGLMIGLEIVDPDQPKDRLRHYPASSTLAKAIKMECFRLGLIVETGGRHGSVIRLLPPLVISDDELEQVVATLRTAVTTVSRRS